MDELEIHFIIKGKKMAVVTSSGTNSSTQLTASWQKSFSRINSGTAVGNFSAGVVKSLGTNTLANDTGVSFGSKVLAKVGTGANTTDRFGISGAIPGGTLAYNAPATRWIMYGVGVTTNLNNTSNNTIYTAGASWNGRQENFVTAVSGTMLLGSGTINSFDFYADPNGTINPNFTKAANAGSRANFVRPSGAGTVATNAADYFMTRAVPGELTYRFGGANPVLADYRAKDSFES